MKRDVLEVKADRTQNEFIRGQTLRDGERVEDDVAAKDQAAPNRVNNVHRLSKWNKQVDEANHHCGVNVIFK